MHLYLVGFMQRITLFSVFFFILSHQAGAQLWQESGTKLSLRNGAVLISGANVILNEGLSSDISSGLYIFSSDSALIQSPDSLRIGYLGVNTSSGLKLSQHIWVDSLLDMEKGLLHPSTKGISMSGSASFSGIDSNRYVVGDGVPLHYINVQDTQVLFPYGTSDRSIDFSPLMLTGTLGNLDLSFKVFDGAWSSYSGIGSPSGSPQSGDYLKRSWLLSSSASSLPLDLNISIDSSLSGTRFSPKYPILNSFDLNAGKWNQIGPIGSSKGPRYSFDSKYSLDRGIQILGISSLIDLIQVGASSFCEGDSTSIWIPAQGPYSYQWRKDGISIAGATDTLLGIVNGGMYDVILFSGADSLLTVPVDIRLLSRPVATISAVGLPACMGDSVVLNTSQGSGWTYHWAYNSASIPGAQSSSLTVSASGMYMLAVTDTNGCSSRVDSFDLKFRPSPSAKIIGTSKICFDDTASLMAPDSSHYSYEWLFNSSHNPGLGTSFNTSVNISGDYQVEITDTFGCTAISTVFRLDRDTVKVPTPVIVNTRNWFCEGDSLLLQDLSGWTYRRSWQFNGQPISSDTSVWASSVGSYQLEYSLNGRCREISSFVSVSQVDTAKTQIWASTISTYCKDDSISIGVTSSPMFSYSWRFNGQDIGKYDSLLWVNRSGLYDCQVSRQGRCPVISPKIEVFESKVHLARLSIPGKDTLCPGDSSLLIISPDVGRRYDWHRDSLQLFSGNSNSIYGKMEGLYWAQLMDQAGCSFITDSLSLTVLPGPLKPSIIRRQDSLLTNASGMLQWFRNGRAIAGATLSEYALDSNGVYTVAVTDSFGCLAISDSIIINGLSLDDIEPLEVRIHPNPNQGLFRIHSENPERFNITVWDIGGKEVYRRSDCSTGETIQLKADEGYYLLRLSFNNWDVWEKLVIINE